MEIGAPLQLLVTRYKSLVDIKDFRQLMVAR
jgi:hypothetical protein